MMGLIILSGAYYLKKTLFCRNYKILLIVVLEIVLSLQNAFFKHSFHHSLFIVYNQRHNGHTHTPYTEPHYTAEPQSPNSQLGEQAQAETPLENKPMRANTKSQTENLRKIPAKPPISAIKDTQS